MVFMFYASLELSAIGQRSKEKSSQKVPSRVAA